MEVDCDRQQRQCILATAEYYMDHPHITISYYSVVQWDKHGLIAMSSEGTCMTNKLIVGFADQSMTQLNEMKVLPDDQKKACAYFGADKSATMIFVAKGTERWEREHWPGLSDRKK